MAKKLGIYKCEICGNIIQVVHEGKGELVCCGKPMTMLAENSVDASMEKHVPVIEKTSDGILVKVGSAAHPMLAEHYIEWIQVTAGDTTCTHFLKPGEAPEAFFKISDDNVTARVYCNLHGLWKS